MSDISDRTKSILLQVAFKAAANTQPLEKVEEVTSDFYLILTGMHDKLGLKPDTDKPASGRKYTPRADKVESAASNADVPQATLADGNTYLDFRGLKALGAVKENFPDFKTLDRKSSKWLTKDGEPTEFAVAVGLA